MGKHKILVVDDDPIVIQIMQMLFDETLEVICASNGDEGLHAVAGHGPDIVLLDIQMDGMDGYEACRRIRLLDLDSQPYVIFVSAHCDPVQRLAAYSVGGEDFVSKPLQPEELVRKVDQALRLRREINDLRSQAQGAMSVAMSAMTDSSALGVCLQYFRQLFSVPNEAQLMEVTLRTMDEFGLNGAVQLRMRNGETKTLNSEKKINPMEMLLLQDLSADRQHIVSYGTRTAFNYGQVSVLIKNMPVDDIERYGKLKDYLALVAEGAAERMNALEKEGLADMLAFARGTINTISHSYQRQQGATRALFDKMREEFEDALMYLGLSEAQEGALIEIISKTNLEVDQLYSSGLALDEHMSALYAKLGGEEPTGQDQS
ncbi:PleD family two-component system response regulator [Chromobacterium sp. IIBBL 290-4]|uniref:response regulator n=1 Tax=Chromobacterium sp. IIBBL 290-4 TaxID=2953890 RepID=UPI0020B7713D|nr:response regulator [Chromobacterium sp. IIBBL 290-4]UTH73273.1 response regulator [Chromobacterium sp. IIBBL 290-4]